MLSDLVGAAAYEEIAIMEITVYVHPAVIAPLVLVFIFVAVKTIIEIIP